MRVHHVRAGNVPGGALEVWADAGDPVVEAPGAAGAVELGQPHGRVADGDAVVRARAADLAPEEVELAEHVARVGGEHGVAALSLRAVGEGEARRRVQPVVGPDARDVEEGPGAVHVVDRGQVREVPAPALRGQAFPPATGSTICRV